MFVRSALLMTGAGLAIGLCAAIALTQLMRSPLFGITPVDPFTDVTVTFIVAAAAPFASYLPARSAAAVDPIETLRAE